MKPKTIMQKLVYSLYEKYYNDTEIPQRYIDHAKTVFTKYAFKGKKTTACLECGHIYLNQKEKNQTCPNCNVKLKVIETNKRKDVEDIYYSAIERKGSFQVIRTFQITKYVTRKEKPKFHVIERTQFWYQQKELKNPIIISQIRNGNMGFSFYDTWSGGMEIRKSLSKYYLSINGVYPYFSLVPELKKRIDKKMFKKYYPQILIEQISNYRIESIYKHGLMRLFDYIISDNREIYNEDWSTIKICIRNNYDPIDPVIYFDYLNNLKIFNKDVLNPKYVCPKYLYKEHQRYLKKIQKMQKRKVIKKALKEKENAENSLRSLRKDLFNIEIPMDQIKIKVLKTIDEYIQEGELQDHCVYTNKYYEKNNSLILSARDQNNMPVETIEFDLSNYKVIQSRGRFNKNSKYHDDIIKEVESKKDVFKKINQKRLKLLKENYGS